MLGYSAIRATTIGVMASALLVIGVGQCRAEWLPRSPWESMGHGISSAVQCDNYSATGNTWEWTLFLRNDTPKTLELRFVAFDPRYSFSINDTPPGSEGFYGEFAFRPGMTGGEAAGMYGFMALKCSPGVTLMDTVAPALGYNWSGSYVGSSTSSQ